MILMVESIFLITSSDIPYLTKNKFALDKSKPVALDYQSHIELDVAGIDHLVIDDYISYEDYGQIDQIAHTIPMIWPSKTGDILIHESINLGEVIEWELVFALVRFIRLFFGIRALVHSLRLSEIIVHKHQDSVNRIAQLISEKSKLKCTFIDTGISKSNSLFWLDNISVTLNFAGRPITMVLPRPIYYEAKKIIDSLGRIIATITSDKNTHDNSVLLLDFNLVNYKPLMLALRNKNVNVLLINQRRPIIWNISSLKIFRELGFPYNSLQQYLTPSLEKEAKDKIEQLHSYLDNLPQDSRFIDLFSFKGSSFWSAFSDDFISFCKKRLEEAVYEAMLGGQVLEAKRPKSILVWSDHSQFEKTMVLLGKARGTPTFVIQHGVLGNILRKDQLVWASQDNKRIYADYFCCWGRITQNWYLKNGIPESKLVITGSPRYDPYFAEALHNEQSGNILLATSGIPSNTFSVFSSVRTIEQYESKIRTVCSTVRKFQEKHFIVKLHPYADEGFDIVKAIRQENPQAHIIKNANIVETIKNSDLVISTGSSVLLEAMILNKPTIMLRYIKGVEQQEISYSEFGASIGLDGDNGSAMEEAIRRILYDNEFRNKLILRGQDYVNQYLEYHNISSQRLAEVITER